MSNFIIEDDSLMRQEKTFGYRSGENVVFIEKQLVITKEEFLACYNKWVKGEEE